eukprot:TRINITY_DN71236_c0_g1_i1.p2 TRINITY_DN71236_c0_g1~~TRINITY_DN71236_c0_g1_i1.p2  ORF type:complete len:418 (-),score=26.79 TRINITY_DN71236_c0_g1_i1:883-2052(-)
MDLRHKRSESIAMTARPALKETTEQLVNFSSVSSFGTKTPYHHRRGCSQQRQSLDLENLIAVCSHKLSANPSHKKALFIRATSFMKKGLYKECITDCNRIMSLDPSNAVAYYTRGCAYEKLGMLDNSISDFTKALEIDPNHINAAYARGACENKRGNFAQAIDFYTMALEKDNKANAAVSPMKIRVENADYILEPAFTENHGTVDDCTFGRRSTSRCSNLRFSDALDKNAENEAERLHALGYECRKKGDFVKAVDYYTKSLEIRTKNFKVLFNRGFAYDKLGEYDKAIQDYSRAIEVEPTNAYAFYNRGISFDKKGNYAEAINNFTMAIALDCNNADFYHNRGCAYRKTKEFYKAIEDYTKAIELAPSHFKVYLFSQQTIGCLQLWLHT